MKLENVLSLKRIYLIGIGGVSMSSLAKYLQNKGIMVSGSDISPNVEFANLRKLGIQVEVGHFPDRVRQADAIVYTDAISAEDVELNVARAEGIPCYTRMQLLNAIANTFPASVAVAGSHGKTSTVCMCAHILAEADHAFTAHIGGYDETFGNYFHNGEHYFLTEACEYKKNLLQFTDLFIAIWLNCEPDHMECYRDLNDLRATFFQYAAQAKHSVVNGDDANIVELPQNAITFGINGEFDYKAVKITQSGEVYSFTVQEYGKELCRVNLKVAGFFHIYNVLAAVAAMRLCGVEPRSIERGVHNFKGVKRRFEKLGEWRGAEFICDYAHHPTEILKILNVAKKRCKGKLQVIFQPHTYSRTKLLMEDFVNALSTVEELVIYKTYPAREEFDKAGSAHALHTQLKNSLYAESIRELSACLKGNVKSGGMVLFLGAGDIYYIAKQILENDG